MRQWSWPGLLYGGRTPERRDVVVTVTPTALRIEAEGMAPLWWPYRELHQARTFQPDEFLHIRYWKSHKNGISIFAGRENYFQPKTER